jgi:hypothetical protein
MLRAGLAAINRPLALLGAAALLSGCADFGGPIGGNGPINPQEQRLQALETRLGEVARKVENLSLAAQSQAAAKLEAEVRGLRGEVERMRYELESRSACASCTRTSIGA